MRERMTDQQLAEIEARANAATEVARECERISVVRAPQGWRAQLKQGAATITDLAADVPALLAEVQALRAQRAALAGVLAAVETPAHNAAVLRSGVNMLDYTHGMESVAPAATDETASETARDVVERERRAHRRGFIAGMLEDGTPTDKELQRRIGQAYPHGGDASSQSDPATAPALEAR